MPPFLELKTILKKQLTSILSKNGYTIIPLTKPDLPIEASMHDRKIRNLVEPFTMTTPERVWALMSAVRYCSSNIPGDFVECGVWRGGSAMVMAYTLLELGITDTKIWLYDTFEGMTHPSSHDVELASGIEARDLMAAAGLKKENSRNVWCYATQDDVSENLRTTGYPVSSVHLVKGDVVNTLKREAPDRISLLRLDTDFYESTLCELETLYPRLQPGGVCIIDDYGYWSGSKKATDEYKTQDQSSLECHR
jgi:O-methyltransferase